MKKQQDTLGQIIKQKEIANKLNITPILDKTHDKEENGYDI
jgi:hypothetical protein